MQISVPLINGMLADEYGKYAPAADMLADHPIKSFPIKLPTHQQIQRHLHSSLLIMTQHLSVALLGSTG